MKSNRKYQGITVIIYTYITENMNLPSSTSIQGHHSPSRPVFLFTTRHAQVMITWVAL